MNGAIPVELVAQLIREQFPHWAQLPLRPVEVSGHDNRMFRLGSDMVVRLPSAERYAAKVKIEQKWLPWLAPQLSITIPKPLALGQPTEYYPWHWSIYAWIAGTSANQFAREDLNMHKIAEQLARFLKEVHAIDSSLGPQPGEHNFFRGAHPAGYGAETEAALSQLEHLVDSKRARALWQRAISSQWDQAPVWVHGDLSSGNILIQDRMLAAVIDFGGICVGDPACDLVIAWTFFKDESREVFRSAVAYDQQTWARARGWALWKAAITLVDIDNKTSPEALTQQKAIVELLQEQLIS